MKHNKFPITKTFLTFFLCIIVVASSFFLPDIMLKNRCKDTTAAIVIAPEEYYVESGNAMARNTSSRLNSLEQTKLISGSWDSTGVQCDTSEAFLTENQAIQLAKYNLDIYYNTGVFPYSLSTNYNNWYSWETKLYCYTDNLFNTYSAYLWVIKFTKFDNTLSHTIYMTETGVILCAETTDTSFDNNKIISTYTDNSVKTIFENEDITLIKKEMAPENIAIPAVYPETNSSNTKEQNIYILELVTPEGNIENYYVYQYENEDVYGIGIAPCPQ